MPANRNALIRYKTIDKCLQNRYRLWTLDDLIEACSDALYEYEGILKGVSRRTIQADVQFMRSDKLGYNAPIIVVDKKYYTYDDADYSITNVPLTNQDMQKLNETVEFLKQFKGFTHFRELDSMIQKLEAHVYSQATNQAPVIDFEKNEDLKGLEYLEVLYQAIINRKPIKLTYQSFTARKSNTFDFHCYLLKEYRNRWFVIGVVDRTETLMNLALDRIISVDKSEIRYIPRPGFSADEYYKNTIGVTISSSQPVEKVILYIIQKHAPYVLTKPFHSSQKLIEEDHYGITISMKVQLNFELEKEILAFGDAIKVIAPESLRKHIRDRLQGGIDLYNTDISTKGLVALSRKIEHLGFGILSFVYTVREIRKIKAKIDNLNKTHPDGVMGPSMDLSQFNQFKPLLINKNLSNIIKCIDKNLKLINLKIFQYPYETEWHQQIADSESPIEMLNDYSFRLTIYLDDSNVKNGALNIVPRSHRKELSIKEIRTIVDNINPVFCLVPAGGVLLTKPLLLRSHPKAVTRSKKREIELDFIVETKA